MEKHLTESIKRYPESERQSLIHPISEIDAQIMIEVIELFKKLNFTAGVDVLKKWKLVCDEDVALDLLDLNTEIGRVRSRNEVESQENSKPLFIRYLNSCGRRIDLFLIISYDSMDIPTDSGVTYLIVLNPTPKDTKNVPMYSNEALIYVTEGERNSVLSLLDNYMETYRGLFLK